LRNKYISRFPPPRSSHRDTLTSYTGNKRTRLQVQIELLIKGNKLNRASMHDDQLSKIRTMAGQQDIIDREDEQMSKLKGEKRPRDC